MATFSVSLNFSRGPGEAASVELIAAASLVCAPGRSKRITVELTFCRWLNATPAASHALLMRGMPVPYCSIMPERKSTCAMFGLRCLKSPPDGFATLC